MAEQPLWFNSPGLIRRVRRAPSMRPVIAPAIPPMNTPRIMIAPTASPSKPPLSVSMVASAIPANKRPATSAPGHTPSAAHSIQRLPPNKANAPTPIPANDRTTKIIASEVSACMDIGQSSATKPATPPSASIFRIRIFNSNQNRARGFTKYRSRHVGSVDQAHN